MELEQRDLARSFALGAASKAKAGEEEAMLRRRALAEEEEVGSRAPALYAGQRENEEPAAEPAKLRGGVVAATPSPAAPRRASVTTEPQLAPAPSQPRPAAEAPRDQASAAGKVVDRYGAGGGFGGMHLDALSDLQADRKLGQAGGRMKEMKKQKTLSDVAETLVPGSARTDAIGSHLVRQYAYWGLYRSARHAGTLPPETVYWNPLLIADGDGKASVQFSLGDTETTYRVLVNGHADGRIGSQRGEIVSAAGDR
jgi:hypothetical protein